MKLVDIFKKDKSYSKHQIKIALFNYWIFYIFCALYLAWFFYLLKNHKFTWFVFSSDTFFGIALGFFLCVLMQFFYRLLDSFLVQTDIKLSIAKQGDEGERAVYLEMIKIFDAQRYRIYKNFKIPGRNFDIDFLIIGPKGVLVFEVKNSACSYIFSDQKMVKIIGNQYSQQRVTLTGKYDMRTKLLNHCRSLQHYFHTLGFSDIKVRKALVFINSPIKVEGKTSVYVIGNIDKLSDYIKQLPDNPRFTPQLCSLLDAELSSIYRV